MKIHISFVCLKIADLYLMKLIFFIREIFRSICNENTDPFLFKKNFRYIFNKNTDLFFRKKFKYIFNKNTDLFFIQKNSQICI